MTAGLWVFVVVVLLSVVGLLVDESLKIVGATTISAQVQAQPLLGVAIIAVELSGVLGLASHFMEICR